MHIILILMMIGLIVTGFWLVKSSISGLLLRRTIVPELVKTQGLVTEIHTETRLQVETGDRKRKHHNNHQLVHYPIIQYQTTTGETVTFKSELGDVTQMSSGQPSKYYVEQILPIVYDPQGRLQPMIDSWWGIWGGLVSSLVGGVVFMLGSGLIK